MLIQRNVKLPYQRVELAERLEVDGQSPLIADHCLVRPAAHVMDGAHAIRVTCHRQSSSAIGNAERMPRWGRQRQFLQ